MSPARLHALRALDNRDLPGWPEHALPRLRSIALDDPRDVDLSERIVIGVIKQLLPLQYAIAALSGRPIDRVDVAVQKILAVALEQMRSLDRVPVHAIVDDAVEMTRRIGPRGATGFVNAILRKAAPTRGRVATEPTRTAPDVAERTHSFPAGVFTRLASLYGEARALTLCERFNAEPPLLARLLPPMTLRSLRGAGVDATAHATSPNVVVLPATQRAALRDYADRGWCQVQDATSAETVADLDVRPRQRVLDRCAGRGTKTRQLLEAIGDAGQVVAMDPSRDRLASLRSAFGDALAAGRLMVVEGEMLASSAVVGDFDRILIDAPCSNSGVFARRPEARYRQNPRELRSIATTQRAILDDSLARLSPGGTLVYATCSVWPEENEAIVQQALRGRSGYALVRSRSVPPNPDADATRYRDGGFAATITRE